MIEELKKNYSLNSTKNEILQKKHYNYHKKFKGE